MKRNYILFVFILIIACNEKSNKISHQEKNLIDASTKSSKKTIEFENYVTEALLFPGSYQLFDDSLKPLESITIDKIESVKIVAKTKEKYRLVAYDNCQKANYVKAQYNGKLLLFFGMFVNEINQESIFKTSIGDIHYSVFTITNFAVPSFIKDYGLTGCDNNGYKILVIKRLTDNHYSLLKDVGERFSTTRKLNQSSILLSTSYAEENIYKILSKQDTIVLGIKAYYQMGGASFNLKILYNDNFSSCILSDSVGYNYDELDKLDKLK